MKIGRLRSNFPHTQNSVYVNHAATGPLSTPVLEAIHVYLEERHFSKIENYFQFQPVIEETKQRLARMIGSTPNRVEFVPNTSFGLNILANGLDWQRGDRIAVPACEFPANVYPFLNLKRLGVEVDFIPHRRGALAIDDIEAALTPRTRLLTLSWVQFLSGFRVDLEEVGALCRSRDVVFCVDAIQGLGALRLDVERCGIDFLASSCHKWMMAAQGIGFIYVSERVIDCIAPAAGWLHGPVDWDNFFEYELLFHPDAERFRMGTLNHIGVASVHASLGLYEEAGPDWCAEQVLDRASVLACHLERLGLRRYGSSDPAHASGIATFEHPNPEGIFEYLRSRRIEASLRNRMIRFAPTWYNTSEEMEMVAEAVEDFGV